nr:DUF4192 domain-containing protein [Nocardioides okcheonensis]
MRLVVRSPEDLLAAVPHMLGFQPAESLVVVPFGPDLPALRVDLPTNPGQREDVWEAVHEGLNRHVRGTARAGIICFTADNEAAERASHHLANRLDTIGVTTYPRLQTHDDRWRDLDTVKAGVIDTRTVTRVAAEMVLAGAAEPAVSRAALAASLVGDRTGVARALDVVRARVTSSPPRVERAWAQARLQQFHADGNRLTDRDAARTLVSLETIDTRDALWADMTRENAASHVALWTDLTRRAPDEARTAPATMLAFSSWLRGDGARAWCALDQIPPGPPYSMAAIVASMLEHGLHPREWERLDEQMRQASNEVDESLNARSAHDPRRDPPRATDTTQRSNPRR